MSRFEGSFLGKGLGNCWGVWRKTERGEPQGQSKLLQRRVKLCIKLAEKYRQTKFFFFFQGYRKNDCICGELVNW